MIRIVWFWLLVVAVLVGNTAGSCWAGSFDGEQPLICATIQVTECFPTGECAGVSIEEAAIPRFNVIDVKNKTITPTRESGVGRQSMIERVEVVDGKLILQGAEGGAENVRDGFGWTIAVGQESGNFVLTASGDETAFVIFGACTVNQ